MAKRTVQSGPRVMTGAPELIPGNPTDLSATAEQVGGKARVRVKYKPPVTPNGFKGAHGYLEAPAHHAPSYGQRIGELVVGESSVNKKAVDMGKFDYSDQNLDDSGFVIVTFPDQPLPGASQQWRCYLAPYSGSYDVPFAPVTVLVGPSPETPTPSALVTVEPLERFGIGEEYAPRVRDLVVTVLGPDWVSAQWQYKLQAAWTDPVEADAPDRYKDFNSVEVEIIDTDGKGTRHRVGKGAQLFVTDYRPVPREQASGSVRVHSQNQAGDTNTYALNVTPEKPYTTPEYPALNDVQNFSVIAGFGYHPQTGEPVLILAPYFDLPADATNFSHIQLRVKPDTTWVHVNSPGRSTAEDPGSKAYIAQEFYPEGAVDWDCVAVSVGIDGEVKWPDPQVPGTSPTAVAAIPDWKGASGVDYCDNPTSVECEIVYPTGDPDGDGIENYGFRFRYTPPDDPRFSGCTPVAVDGSGRQIPLGQPGRNPDPGVWQYTDSWSIHNPTTFTVWFPGRDFTNRVNGNGTLASPIPSVGPLPVTYQTAGGLNPTRFNPGKIDGNVYYNSAGKFSLRVNDSTEIGIGPGGITLNGVPMGKALAGSYDAAVFGNSGGVFQQVAVRLGSLVSGSYDPQLFTTPSGIFKLKYGGQFTQTASGLEVDNISANIINTGILRVGNATAGSPSYMGVYNGGSLVGWVGTNGVIIGGWMKEFYVGGTSPANAKVYVDGSGNAYFSGNVGATSMTSGTFNVGTYNNSGATGVYCYKWNGSANVLVGWMGANGAIVGGWCKEFYIGGTSPANAQIYCDSLGNAIFSGSILATQVTSGGTLIGVAMVLTGSGYNITINGTDRMKVQAGVGTGQYSQMTENGLASYATSSTSGQRCIISSSGISIGTGFAVPQILTSMATGWSLPSGTPTRTSFNTGTVTLAQLAERVYALINDLYSHHRLIG